MTLAEATKEWEQIAHQMWRDLRKGHGIILFAFRPQITMAADLAFRRMASQTLMAEAVTFFRKHGHEVTCEMCADGESFNIYGPPEPLAQIKTPANEP